MKHNLKRKYEWKRRSWHFSELRMQKRWTKVLVDEITKPNIFDELYKGDKFIRHEPSETVRAGGESALDGKPGTTIPGIIINKLKE